MDPDRRLVAALIVLRDHLCPVVDDLLAGRLANPDRRDLARALRTVADDLDPITIIDTQP
ncbi:MAG TPA: hypothetical protein VFV67_10720 [Actinophytocola sp.]|uniref:hypothetical protein n=1 Tax=Actinophytocola sp. TaxID=1872138 RepID=UPI002DB99A1E|nr:hypothetical protein [Actinophytocola sp.]HEU5471116.1 hypothetical protein [Actinophytocola sp.]